MQFQLKYVLRILKIGGLLLGGLLLLSCSRAAERPQETTSPQVAEPVSISASVSTPIATQLPATPPPSPAVTEAAQANGAAERLAILTQAEGVAVFNELVDQAYAESHYSDSNDALWVFGKELLVRFPELNNSADFMLRLATLEERVPGVQSAQTFYQALRLALNVEKMDLSQLERWIAPYGFEIAANIEAVNLFEDGQDAQVLQIDSGVGPSPQRLTLNAVVVVLRDREVGEIDLIPLRKNWIDVDNHYGGGEKITVADWNGNGRLNISSEVVSAGRNGCTHNFDVFAWQANDAGGQFVDIWPFSDEGYGFIAFHCENISYFTLGDQHSPLLLIRQTAFENHVQPQDFEQERCLGLQRQAEYRWNGTTYEFVEAKTLPYVDNQPDICRLGWAYYASPELAIVVVEPALAVWQPEYNAWGEATEDAYLFHLGYWHALEGNFEEARSVMARLRDTPPTPEFTFLPALAGIFLEAYQTPSDLFPACAAVVETAASELKNNSLSPNAGQGFDWAKENWGFALPFWQLGMRIEELCDRQPLFSRAVDKLDVLSAEKLTDWSKEYGIPLFLLANQDFSGDGQPDWLVAVQIRSGWTVYMFTPGQDGVEVDYVDSLFSDLDLSVVTIEPLALDSGPAYLVYLGQELFIFQFSDGSINRMLSRSQVEKYTLLVEGSLPTIQITGSDGEDSVYTWDPTENVFSVDISEKPPWVTQHQSILEVKERLFTRGDVDAAILLLEEILAGNIIEPGPEDAAPTMEPQLIYLLGLAYELTVNEAAALEQYLALRETFPDNQFSAILAVKLRESE